MSLSPVLVVAACRACDSTVPPPQEKAHRQSTLLPVLFRHLLLHVHDLGNPGHPPRPVPRGPSRPAGRLRPLRTGRHPLRRHELDHPDALPRGPAPAAVPHERIGPGAHRRPAGQRLRARFLSDGAGLHARLPVLARCRGTPVDPPLGDAGAMAGADPGAGAMAERLVHAAPLRRAGRTMAHRLRADRRGVRERAPGACADFVRSDHPHGRAGRPPVRCAGRRRETLRHARRLGPPLQGPGRTALRQALAAERLCRLARCRAGPSQQSLPQGLGPGRTHGAQRPAAAAGPAAAGLHTALRLRDRRATGLRGFGVLQPGLPARCRPHAV